MNNFLLKTTLPTPIFIFICVASSYGQIKFGDNKTTINAGSLLEMESTNKGLQLPRVSLTTTTSWGLSGIGGTGGAAMMVYNTNTGITAGSNSYPILSGGKGMYYWDGAGWLGMTYPFGIANGQYWVLTGNSGTTASAAAIGAVANNNFIGTTDAKDFVLASNSRERMRITAAGNVGIRTLAPQELLQVGNAASGNANPAILLQSSSNVDGEGGILRFREANYPTTNYGIDLRHNTNAGTNNASGLYFDVIENGVTNDVMVLTQPNGWLGLGISNPAAVLDILDATSQQNLVNAIGNVNNYLQFNIQNKNAGNSASGDLVVTADNGTSTSHYIDVGINSSTYAQNNWGYANGAYVYASDDTLRIGTQAAKPLIFNTGGAVSANERMRIDPSGNVGIATISPAAILDVAGTFKLGANGSIQKNEITGTVTILNAPLALTAGTGNVIVVGGTTAFTAAGTDLNVDLTALAVTNRPTSTRAVVSVSPAADMPASISIASAYLTTSTNLRIRFLNSSTTARSFAVGTIFYISIKEF